MEQGIGEACSECHRYPIVSTEMRITKISILLGVLLSAAIAVRAQNSAVVPTPPADEQLANRKQELLRHPTFINLRLVSERRYVPREESTETPAPYKVKDWIVFRLLVNQSLVDDISVHTYRNPHYEVRPLLRKDGDTVPYSKQADAAIERADWSMPPASELTLKPGSEYDLQEIRIDDWYDPLPVGSYELTVRRRFDWQGDWLTSSPIYFEVQPRTPGSPVPSGVIIELAPEGVQPRMDGKPYQLGSEVFITFLVRNKSDQSLKINVIDRDYSNRPELLKDGKLVPYLEQADTLIKSKEENPRLVQVVNDFFLDAHTGTWPDGIDLRRWYGALSPGSYRLVLRRRFEVDGPWSEQSKPLLFEIPATKSNQH